MIRLRAERDNRAVRAALTWLNEAARGDETLVRPTLEAVGCYAALGQICGQLRQIFGKYRAPTAV